MQTASYMQTHYLTIMANDDNKSAQQQLPPVDDHKSASEQFVQIISSAKKLAKGVNVGKSASDTFYYGSNSIKNNISLHVSTSQKQHLHVRLKSMKQLSQRFLSHIFGVSAKNYVTYSETKFFCVVFLIDDFEQFES